MGGGAADVNWGVYSEVRIKDGRRSFRKRSGTIQGEPPEVSSQGRQLADPVFR